MGFARLASWLTFRIGSAGGCRSRLPRCCWFICFEKKTYQPLLTYLPGGFYPFKKIVEWDLYWFFMIYLFYLSFMIYLFPWRVSYHIFICHIISVFINVCQSWWNIHKYTLQGTNIYIPPGEREDHRLKKHLALGYANSQGGFVSCNLPCKHDPHVGKT